MPAVSIQLVSNSKVEIENLFETHHGADCINFEQSENSDDHMRMDFRLLAQKVKFIEIFSQPFSAISIFVAAFFDQTPEEPRMVGES